MERGENSDERGAQIDMLVEYQNNLYDIVECKFLNREFIIENQEAEKIKNRVEIFKKYGIKSKSKYDIKLVLLTSYGAKINRYYNALNIAEGITIDELMG